MRECSCGNSSLATFNDDNFICRSCNCLVAQSTLKKVDNLVKDDFQPPEPKNLPNSFNENILKTIAVDLTPILPGGENGGAKIFVLELIKRLARLAPKTQFILLTQAAAHQELCRLEGTNIECKMVLNQSTKNSIYYRLFAFCSKKIPYFSHKFSGLAYRVHAFLKRKGNSSLLKNMSADLLFCPFTAPTYYEVGIPTVCTLYDLQYKTFPEFFSLEDLNHREHTFIEACRRASMMAAISEYSRQSAIKHGNLKAEKIRTIYLQMAERIAEEEQESNVLTQLDLKPQKYLLFPANFWKHKNHEMLLTAFGIACSQGLATDIKLVCTGTGKERLSFIVEAAHAMNLGERVVFPGYLSNAELSTLLVNSSGMIFPSLYEGFGLPVIEAMATGIPVACSNVTSLPEIVEEAAILFNPRIPMEMAQAILSLQNDKKRRAALIVAGTERAKLFADIDRMAQEYWYLFQHAVKEIEHPDEVTGAYNDGWVGSSLNIQVAASASKQKLEMEFFVPDWIPSSKIVVKTFHNGKPKKEFLDIRRGKNALLTLNLAPEGGLLELRMTPSFIPAKRGYSSNDHRELSLMIKRCSIDRHDGATHLIRGNTSA